MKQKPFDSVIVATGFEHFDPARDAKYSYQLFDDVVDIKDLERMMGEGNFARPSNGQPPKMLLFILLRGFKGQTCRQSVLLKGVLHRFG
jgi:Heterodisulfide reductase, subunit A and related polyferredoxins